MKLDKCGLNLQSVVSESSLQVRITSHLVDLKEVVLENEYIVGLK